MPATTTMLTFFMPDGSKWGVHLDVIARHRAEAYAHEYGGDLARSLTEDTLPLFAADPAEAADWASNNMQWPDISPHAVKLAPAPVPDQKAIWGNLSKTVEAKAFDDPYDLIQYPPWLTAAARKLVGVARDAVASGTRYTDAEEVAGFAGEIWRAFGGKPLANPFALDQYPAWVPAAARKLVAVMRHIQKYDVRNPDYEEQAGFAAVIADEYAKAQPVTA